MFSYQIPFGKDRLDLTLDFPADLISPIRIDPQDDPLSAVTNAIENPVDEIKIEDFRGAKSAAIVINDKTRPAPNHSFLPPLVEKLISIGIPPNNINLMIANGTHSPVQVNEFEQIIPKDYLSTLNIISHDCDDIDNLIYLGKTKRETPIFINQFFMNSDIRIVTGEIELHHFMGFSGGVKSACIGLAGRQTINHNHAMLIDPLAIMGEYDRNPMRQDLEEMGDIVQIHLALNAILTVDKKLSAVFFGSPRAVMQIGIQHALKTSQVRIDDFYDLVIASPGGHPKDINLYQSQKAVTHAAQFCKKGGELLIIAACPEGSGSRGFEDFMLGLTSFDEVLMKFKHLGFQVGPHKAFQLARQSQDHHISIFSLMPDQLTKIFLLHPVASLELGFQEALARLPNKPRVAVLPYATNTIPVIA
jgi:lactate racemase